MHMQHTRTQFSIFDVFSLKSSVWLCLFLEHNTHMHMQQTRTQFSISDAFIVKSRFVSAFSVFRVFSLKSSILQRLFLEHAHAHAAFNAAALTTHRRLSLALLPRAGRNSFPSLLQFPTADGPSVCLNLKR